MRVIALSLLALAACAALPAAASAAGHPTVVVRARAAVGDPVVRLGDIARLRGFAPPERARVAAIELGRAPAVGLGQFMPRAYVEARIREGGLPAGTRLQIPARVEISRKARTVTGPDLQARVRDAIESRMPHEPAAVAAIDVPTLADLKLPAGATIDVRFADDERFVGPVVAELVVADRGETLRTRRVSARVEVYETVYGVAEPHRRGERLDAGALVTLRRPSGGLPRDVVRDPSLIDGAVLRRTVEPGEPIREAWLDVPPLVERGDRVRMEAVRGPLRLTARGEALASGARGAWVRVRNLDSGKIVSGKVTAPGVVEMEF